jgi:hypothetical protein
VNFELPVSFFIGSELNIHLRTSPRIRVARFSLIQHTKTGKYTKCPQNIPSVQMAVKTDQMAIKNNNIVHYKTLENLSKWGFLV